MKGEHDWMRGWRPRQSSGMMMVLTEFLLDDDDALSTAGRLRSCSDGLANAMGYQQDGVEGTGEPLGQWGVDWGAGEESYWLLGMGSGEE